MSLTDAPVVVVGAGEAPRTTPPQGSRNRITLVASAAVLLVATIGSLVLRARSPALLLAWASHDDTLYAKLAANIVDGQWLGPYDSVTLAKAPGYPVFLAIAFKAHLPFKMAEHLVHLLAGATIAWGSLRVSGSRIVGVVLFSVIALDPAYLGGTAARVTRDGLYGSLCLLLIGTVVLSLTFVPGLVRRGARWWVPLVFASASSSVSSPRPITRLVTSVCGSFPAPSSP